MVSPLLRVILVDFNMMALFNDYLETKRSEEYLEAYFILQNMRALSPRRKRKRARKFYDTFLVDDAPQQIVFEAASIQRALDNEDINDTDIERMISEVEESLQSNWIEFKDSKIYERYCVEQRMPRMCYRQNRRERDQPIIEYYHKVIGVQF